MCHEESATFMLHLMLGLISVAYHGNRKGAVSVVSAASDGAVWLFIIRLMPELVPQLYRNPISCNVTVLLVKKSFWLEFFSQASKR